MKKKVEQSQEERELEIIKAVAQAWHGHSTTTSTPKSTNEFDAHRLNFKTRPTRFKLEAMTKPSQNNGISDHTSWDFNQSLWDSYEILAVSKRLETGLVLDNNFDELAQSRGGKKWRESKNSLRNILARTSSRRFDL